MRCTERRGSSNVEDRRNMGGGRMALGGGLDTLVILLIVWFMGGDPAQVTGLLEQRGESRLLRLRQRKIKWHNLSRWPWPIPKNCGMPFFSNRGNPATNLNWCYSGARFSRTVDLQQQSAAHFAVRETKRFTLV